MRSDLAQKAIACALSGDWKQALELNQQILKENPKDVDALNRLARAYVEIGDISNAKKTAKNVLIIDPFNSIAQKSLSRWKNLKKGDFIPPTTTNANIFIEEPGKTKTVKLIHPGDDKLLSTLEAGIQVKMHTNSHRVSVCTQEGKYIGKLPDDVSAHIKNLIQVGNDYVVCIKSIDAKSVSVFMRETKRAEKVKNIPSFTKDKVEYVKISV